MRKFFKYVFITLAGSITLVVLLFTLLMIFVPADNSRDPQPFDSQTWHDTKRGERSHDTTDQTLRYLMIDDLVDNHLPIGELSRDDIRKLLGEPDLTEKSKFSLENGIYDAFLYRYWVPIIDYDSLYLVLYYDDNGILISYKKRYLQG